MALSHPTDHPRHMDCNWLVPLAYKAERTLIARLKPLCATLDETITMMATVRACDLREKQSLLAIVDPTECYTALRQTARWQHLAYLAELPPIIAP